MIGPQFAALLPILEPKAARVVKIAVYGVSIALALAGLWVVLVLMPARSAREAALGRSEQATGRVVAKIGSEAHAVAEANLAASAETDEITRKNRDAILDAPDSANPVGRDVDAAGRVALCLRNAYARDPACRRN